MQTSMALLTLTIAITSTSAIAEKIHPDCIRGAMDDDGFVTFTDSDIIQNYIDGNIELSCDLLLHADLNQDRQIDANDVAQLRAEALGLPNQGEFHTWGDTNLDGIFSQADFDLMKLLLHGGITFIPGLLNETSDISGDGAFTQLDLDIFQLCAEDDLLLSPFGPPLVPDNR